MLLMQAGPVQGPREKVPQNQPRGTLVSRGWKSNVSQPAGNKNRVYLKVIYLYLYLYLYSDICTEHPGDSGKDHESYLFGVWCPLRPPGTGQNKEGPGVLYKSYIPWRQGSWRQVVWSLWSWRTFMMTPPGHSLGIYIVLEDSKDNTDIRCSHNKACVEWLGV